MKLLQFYLIPINRGKKVPATPNGEKNASNDWGQVQQWRERLPGCNFAICTGPSDLIVLDFDSYKPNFVEGSLEAACKISAFPETAEIRSARGGRVLLYKRNGQDVPSRNSVLPAIDVRANTGFILCPPSKNAEGQPYTWVRKGPIVAAPPELVAFLQDKQRNVAKRGETKPRRTAPEGEEIYLKAGDGRWEFLRRLGGLLRREGCGPATLFAALNTFAEQQCEDDPTISYQEISRLCTWLAEQPIGVNARIGETMIEKDGKFYAESIEKGNKND